MGELGLGASNGGGDSDPACLRQECLSAAEEAAQQVLNCIHPTLDSEEKRRDIVDYVQRLVKSHLNCEVFPYGSVPLKTYLPDGDIDLTAVNGTSADESLAHEILALLKREEKNVNAEFIVKDTQYIDAEVKLVKCLVRNTVIDISMNQLGGLSTLCFLEQVDRLVGRNHLFKRSIILIKAWCYYESRILGSHHGLISTYGLETLILYIFKLYHSSLCGPLMVLYRFLEFYSEFDWENYCISLKGPVCKSSLPNIVVEVPENGWTDLMFSEEFLENCKEMFSVSSRAIEGNPKPFQPKHLNIVDPLKENNNLGRSVHVGNFYRIRSAFKYGARKLGQILSLPYDKIPDEIRKFFSNAVSMHGNDKNSLQHVALEFGGEDSFTPSSDNMLLKSHSNYYVDDISLHYKDVDLTSVGDFEAFNPLADLGGDYDSHIRSLLYGQLCQGYSFTKNKKPWDIVCQSMPYWWFQFSQMTLWPSPVEQTNSPPPQRNGRHSPHTNGGNQEWRIRKKVDQMNRHGQSNGPDTTPVTKSKENQKRWNPKCPSPNSVGNEKQTSNELNGLWRIEFGSIGNLAEEVTSADTGSSTQAAMKQERFESIHLKNEAEFPPL